MDNEKDSLNAHLKDQLFEDRLETLLLRGETSPLRLGMAFDIEPALMVDHIRKVFDNWKQRRIEDIEETRDLRINQMEMLLRKALTEYDKSQQPTTEYQEEIRVCGFCGGKGKDEVVPGDFVTCKRCAGTGKFKIIKTKTIERQGNPAYLKLAQECIIQAAKLAGLGQSMTFNAINKIGEQVDGNTKHEIEMLTFQGAPENIIGAIAAMDQIRAGIRKGHIKKVPSKPVDPKITNPKDNKNDDTEQ